ncbi:MAG: hypothetical protein V1792_20720 [Pseudomonadota bacterium]
MTDTPKQPGRKVPSDYSISPDVSGRNRTQGSESPLLRRSFSAPTTENGYDFDRIFSAGENGREDMPRTPGLAADKEFTRFQDRLRKGKVKICRACGGVMKKSSRMVLSSAAAVFLLIFGASLMAAYGLAVNFLQTPWYIRYALPASYYVGSLHVGVAILFFFIRERIWYCPECKAIDKR